MSIDIDRDREFYPAIEKILKRIDELEMLLKVINSNVTIIFKKVK